MHFLLFHFDAMHLFFFFLNAEIWMYKRLRRRWWKQRNVIKICIFVLKSTNKSPVQWKWFVEKRQRKMFSLGIVWYSIVEQKSRVNVSKRLRRQRRRSIQRAYTLRVSVRSVGAQTVRPLLHTAQHGVVAVYSRSIEASKQSESE